MAEKINAAGAPRLRSEFLTERNNRADWLSFAVTSLLLLLIYLFTLAPDVTLDFSGIFSTSAMYGGVPHPAGYPVWVIYSWLFTKLLSISTVAWRVAVSSAVAASLACGVVAAIVSRGGGIMMKGSSRFAHLTGRQKRLLRIICGYVAGMALGFSSPVWSKAVVADFRSLSLLLFCLIVWFAVQWISNSRNQRLLFAAFFFLGLLLTNSQEMIIAVPVLAALTILRNQELCRDLALIVLPSMAVLSMKIQFGLWTDFPKFLNPPIVCEFVGVFVIGLFLVGKTRRFGSQWFHVLACLVFLLAGGTFYFYAPIASMMNPPMNWAYSRTVEGFFHLLSREQYERVLPTNNFVEYLGQLRLFAKICSREWGWLYFIPAAIPVLNFFQLNRTSRKWLLALLVVFACVGPLLVAEVHPLLDRQSVQLQTFYFIPALAVLSIFLGIGLMLIASFLTRPKGV